MIDAHFGTAACVPGGDAWAWRPSAVVESFATLAEAVARMAVPHLLEPTAAEVGFGYVAATVRVHTDPLNSERSLVQAFSDGVDTVFVQQCQRPAQPQAGHTLMVYRDAGVTQCRFQHSDLEVLVVGRHAALRDVAVGFYRKAVAAF